MFSDTEFSAFKQDFGLQAMFFYHISDQSSVIFVYSESNFAAEARVAGQYKNLI